LPHIILCYKMVVNDLHEKVMKMLYEKKLDIILKAIVKERKQSPIKPRIKLDLTHEKELAEVTMEEIESIINTLRDKEKVLRVKGITYPNTTEWKSAFRPTIHPRPVLDLIILKDFDRWYSHYIYVKQNSLQDLSFPNIARIYDVVTKIDETIQLSSAPKICVDMCYGIGSSINYADGAIEDLVNGRLQVIDYLERNGIIIDHVIRAREVYGAMDEPEMFVDMNIDTSELKEFLPKITKAYKEKRKQHEGKKERPKLTTNYEGTKSKKQKLNTESNAFFERKTQSTNDFLYKITFTMANEIILNDLVVLSKPNLNSENGEVFHYLFEHPNKTITKKELEQVIEQAIGKDFHKIVENLGFTGDLRKAFFQVSNGAILFRNPITKADFDQLGISPLRINKR